MAKKKKSTKSILDSHVFQDLKEEVVFPTQVPDYQGTPMVIEPPKSEDLGFRVPPHLRLDNLELDLSGVCFTKEYKKYK